MADGFDLYIIINLVLRLQTKLRSYKYEAKKKTMYISIKVALQILIIKNSIPLCIN